MADPTTNVVGDAVSVAGYPGDKPQGTLWGATGNVKSLNNTRFTYDVDVNVGQSGAAVFREGTGYIKGIHTLGFPNSIAQNFNAGVLMHAQLRNAISQLIG